MSFESRVRGLVDSGGLFVRGTPIFIARAPGRLDLMGGNGDYTGGLVFESTIREATWAAAQLRPDTRIVVLNPQMTDSGWEPRIEVDLSELADEVQVRRMVNRDPSPLPWAKTVLEEWERILRAYDLNLSDLLDTQSSKNDDGNGNPKFGFVVECNQKPTLGEWADKNSIDLSLGLPVT